MTIRRTAVAVAMALLGVTVAGCSTPSTATSTSSPDGSVPSASASDGGAGNDGAGSDAVTGDEVTGDGEASVTPEGFSTIQARITDADGEVCEVCLWLADDADERSRGLMGVTDLGDADGMAFVFDDATRGSFYMFQTPSPLSIAWFAPTGEFVGAADMEPCLDTPAGDCALYSPDAAYDVAIEVFAGDLADVGIGPGSVIEFLAGTESQRCDATS